MHQQHILKKEIKNVIHASIAAIRTAIRDDNSGANVAHADVVVVVVAAALSHFNCKQMQ
jgi:hypothetical protein